MPLWYTTLLVLVPLRVCRRCPSPYIVYGNGCYSVSKELGNISQCQDEICAATGGTLASIDSEGLNAALLRMIHGQGWASKRPSQYANSAFIGLYERGEDERGDWVWADGLKSNMTMWAPGEPNNWCLDEDCAVLGPLNGEADHRNSAVQLVGGWFDISCSVHRRCVCQFGRNVSADFRIKEVELGNVTEEASYEQCLVKAKQCWWYENKHFQYAVILVGIPCALTMIYSLASTVRLRLGYGTTLQPAVRDRVVVSSLYGGLLSSSCIKTTSVDDLVDRWVVRGAWGSILYAACLFLLAISTLLHMTKGISFGFAIDATEALAMCVCKFAVALSAFLVHWHLASRSRIVAAWWVLCLAISKLALTMCTMALMIGYTMAALHGGIGSLCTWGYNFCWTLIASFVCECVAALALCRLQQRAVTSAGDPRVFTHVVGSSWLYLVGGTIGGGLGLGIAASLFVFDDPHDHFNPLNAFGFFYLGAAFCQFLAGAAMLRANFQIRSYFLESSKFLVAEEGFDTPAVLDTSGDKA